MTTVTAQALQTLR